MSMPSAAAADLTFLRRFIAKPLDVASLVPSGRALARCVAGQIDVQLSGPIVELGPGTGAITQAILDAGVHPARLAAIERDDEFLSLLENRFPEVALIKGDAFAFCDLLREHGIAERLSAIVCGLPVLQRSREARAALLRGAMQTLREGGVFVQFSYSFRPPFRCPPAATLRKAATVWLNFPPMHVWTYQRAS